MDILLVELKQHVCRFLDDRDLVSIRFLNKSWASVAEISLFKAITITPLTLERLKLIAEHKSIAPCVKRIHFHVDILPSILPEMWHERSGSCHTMEIEPLGFQVYLLAFHEQRRLHENDYKLSREILDSTIPMLKKLHWLTLIIGGDRDLSDRTRKSNSRNQ